MEKDDLSEFDTLLLKLKDLLIVKKRIDDDKKLLDEQLDDLKEEILKQMPTDIYSNTFATLTKKLDLKLKIDPEKLGDEWQKLTPNLSSIKEALMFGMDIEGVEASPVTRLIIRSKNEED